MEFARDAARRGEPSSALIVRALLDRIDRLEKEKEALQNLTTRLH